MKIPNEMRKTLEGKIVAFSSIKDAIYPNAIAVEINKVIEDNKVLITDNYMNQTLNDIKQNQNVAILIWNNERSYKLLGEAQYYTEGSYYEMVKPLNDGYPCKGVIVVEIKTII